MIKPFFTAFLFLVIDATCYGQTVAEDRFTDWTKVGLIAKTEATENIVNILDFEGDNTGETSNNQAYINAINSLNSLHTVIYFPEGTYFFDEPIYLKDSIHIQGEGAEKTIFQFNVSGQSDLINFIGSDDDEVLLIVDSERSSSEVIPMEIGQLKPKDFIRIIQNDEEVVYSDWAEGSTGQINRVMAIEDGKLILEDPLRQSYDIDKNAHIVKLNPILNAGISCVKIERIDDSDLQVSNILLNHAVNCWVKGVESENARFAHVTLSYSSNIEITGSYFHHGFSYGGGGRAYGVVAQYSTGNSLVENNVFEHLRHSMLLQAGPNGNVFAYNYSFDPFWSELPTPQDAAGDMVLHGNYPYLNLFEGNIVQNIVVDNSHGINGPYNTFYRNRAESYGLVVLDNPSTDSQNFIGNDISNTSAGKGFFILNGKDHHLWANQIKTDTVPEGSYQLPDTSYYLNTKPVFFGNHPWPAIGFPNSSNTMSIPAKTRFENPNESVTSCLEMATDVITGGLKKLSKESAYIYPNPNSGKFKISLKISANSPMQIIVYNTIGKMVHKEKITSNEISIDKDVIKPGVYQVHLFENSREPSILFMVVK